MSPERLDPKGFGFEDGRVMNESDCSYYYYALGMVILEVITGQHPFPLDYSDFAVILKVINGKRPERPRGGEAVWLTDDLWKMLEQCWSPKPKLRPTAEAILEHLERASTAWKPLPPIGGSFESDDGYNEPLLL